MENIPFSESVYLPVILITSTDENKDFRLTKFERASNISNQTTPNENQ